MSKATALLVMACSKRKAPGLLRGCAWDIYDGRLYQVLKKALQDYPDWQEHVDVLIVSARYGILRPEQEIETYDEPMTEVRARERSGQWREDLRRAIAGRCYKAIHVNLGRLYLRALPNLDSFFPGVSIEWATRGGIGKRNAQTKRWLLRVLTA